MNESDIEIDDFDDEDREEGQTDYEIPESRKGEETRKNLVSIIDPDGDLDSTADMEDLKAALEDFLQSIDEGRRNFIVSSVGDSEKGFKAVLEFEIVRLDGRNVEVRYDGAYHFRLI